MIPRPVQIAFGIGMVVFMTATPLLYQSYQKGLSRNVRVVKPGVLYRSAQLPLPGLQRLIDEYRIKTIVCLRHGNRENDQAEEKYAAEKGVRFVRIPPRSWTLDDDGQAPAHEGLSEFREVMSDSSNFPVLLHCFAGTHRTGAYVAVYRMDFEGWSNSRAMDELRALGYVTLDDDRNVYEFLSRYEPTPSVMTPVSRKRSTTP